MISIDMTERVALITGGSSGIGLAIARTFAAAGARTVTADLTEPKEAAGRWIKTDVGDFEECGRCVNDVLNAEGQIDYLINNAGISRDAPVWKMTEADWDTVLQTNLKGAFNMIHFVAAHFRNRNAGKIINISSINGLRGKFGLANYSAAKAGLIGLTRTVARELAAFHVNVNAVAPGLIDTPLTSRLPEDVIQRSKSEILLGRIGKPEDVAHAVLFLCSDFASHITGNVLTVDGGQLV